MSEHELVPLTIIVDGTPIPKEYPAHMKIEEVIKSLLPEGDKNQWDKYQLSDREKALNSAQSLLENGVKDNDTLSFTKKDGGGGVFDR